MKYCLVAACFNDQCWEAALNLNEPGAVRGSIIGSSSFGDLLLAIGGSGTGLDWQNLGTLGLELENFIVPTF